MMNTKSNLLSTLVVFAALFGLACGKNGISAQKPDGQVPTCIFEGKTYNSGDTVKVDCNSCQCSENGTMACTGMACRLPDAGGSSNSSDAALSDTTVDARAAADQAQPRDLASAAETSGMSSPDLRSDLSPSKDAPPADTTVSDSNLVPDVAGAGPDARLSCVWEGDMVLSIGQTIGAGDGCNVCTCMASGVSCTERLCISLDAAVLVCTLPSTLTFGYIGGHSAYDDVFSLQGESQITMVRTYYNGRDGGLGSCSPSLPACGAAGVVSISTIAQDLTNAEVEAAFTLPSPKVYGLDSRRSDGVVFNITRASGESFAVGTPCPSSGMDSCRPIPPGVKRLADDLKKLVIAASSASACSRL